MIDQKQIRLAGVNNDDALELLGEGDYLNLMNARIGLSQGGKAQRIENIYGTKLLSQSVYPPYGSNKCIGSVTDTQKNRIIYFIYNTVNDNGIYCHDIASQVTYAVIYDSQIVSGLGFSKDYFIARNAKVVGDLLIFTDNLNEPRSINIEAGIKANQSGYVTTVAPYAFPLNYEDITLVKRTPIYPQTSAKRVDGDFVNNYIYKNAYQFTYRYIYRDNQYSELAAFSNLQNANLLADQFNCIDIKVPYSEKIDNIVSKIEFIVRYGNSGKSFVYKQYNKADTVDAAAIVAHNAGTTQLGVTFYDDILGIAVDDIEANTSAPTVPIYAKTLEVARNRLFLGSTVNGYTTPLKTSLSAVTSTDTGASTVTGSWWTVYWTTEVGINKERSFIYLTNVTGYASGYYFYSTVLFPPDPPLSIAIGDLTFQSADIDINIIDNDGTITSSVFRNLASTITGASSASLGGQSIFKSNSTYFLSIAFYDRFRRKCGVVKKSVKVVSDKRQFGNIPYTTAINWTLQNTDSLNEIPDWAYYYQIHTTKNITTRFFLQTRPKTSTYVDKNSITGGLTYAITAYASTVYAVAFDLSLLYNYGLGYTYTDGDLLNVYVGTSFVTLRIIGVDGNYVLCSPKDLGILNSSYACVVELFTPYKSSTSEPYFETGLVYSVTNPATSLRSYSVLSSSILGDITILTRKDVANIDYLVEAMSPNDLSWQIWETNTGWANFFDSIGQTKKTTTISFSDTYINGTQINGLNRFQPLNQKEIGFDTGGIQKLQLVSKEQQQGTVMLVICTNDTLSAYLEETQVVASSTNTFVSVSLNVIGTVNSLKARYGTTTPETVVQYLDNVFWIDLLNGVAIQYSTNGLFPISSYKMASFFQKYAKDYMAASTSDLDNINGFHIIPTCIDPFHKRFTVTLPALIYQNYAPTLPSYSSIPSYATSIIDRFDIYDKLGKTLTFSLDENRWKENFEYTQEWMEYNGNLMFGFKNGAMYIHDADSVNYNKFYGTQYPVRFCYTPNLPISTIKDMMGLTIEGNVAPDFSVCLVTYPNQQITDLTSSDYTDKEGVFYASLFRDRLSPNTSGTPENKMYYGDVLRGKTPMIQVEFKQYNALMYIQFTDVAFSQSRGQKSISPK